MRDIRVALGADLALTQLLVEIVTTVLILLGLRGCRNEFLEAGNGKRLSSMQGYGALAISACPSLPGQACRSLPMRSDAADAGTPSRGFSSKMLIREAEDVTSSTLTSVDFRAFDTLGEVVVLATVAITVYSLLRRFRPAPESVDEPEQQQIQNAYDEARPEREVGDTIADYLFFRQ